VSETEKNTRKNPNFLAPSQPTGDWGLVMRRRGIGGTIATRESREGGGKGAARKILRRGREVNRHGAGDCSSLVQLLLLLLQLLMRRRSISTE